MSTLLDKAKELYWVDSNNDGKNDEYDWGGPQEGDKGPWDGTTDNDGNGKSDIDCSHLVNNVLQSEGYKIPYLPTAEMNSGKGQKYFETFSSGQTQPQPGDIILFKKHVGIVESYNPETKSGTYFGSQSQGPATTNFGKGSGYWDQPYTILRPKSEFSPEGSGSIIGFFDKIIDSILSKIRSIFNAGESTPTPIILDLDKDGIETTALTSGTYFDHDNNGFSEQTGWASSDDGLLVMDRDADGLIEDGTELFGDNTLLANGTKAANGFQALAELDSNTDGKIDINDAAFSQLRIWQDIDEDGFTSEGELHSFRLLFSV